MAANSRGRRRVGLWLGQAAGFALACAGLKLLVHVGSPYAGDTTLLEGIALGLAGDFGLGALVALPHLGASRRFAYVTSFLPGLVLLASVAGAHHAHEVLRYLPGRESVAFLREPGALWASLEEHAAPDVLAAEVAAGCVLWLVLGHLIGRALGQLRFGPGVLLIVGVALEALVGIVLLTHGQLHHGASQPLLHVWLAKPPAEPAWLTAKTEPARAPSPITALLRQVADVIEPQDLGAPPDPDYPYCRQRRACDRDDSCEKARNPRSIVMVILESVGAREAALHVKGKPVMPALSRIAADGVQFSRFYAAGDKSSQGLVGLFSGISSETHRRILSHAPLVHLPGLPRELARAGYRTAYLHGSDLSFEQQRAYLRGVGMQTLIEPTPRQLAARVGWGLPDGVMFDELTELLAQQRKAHPEEPVFATLFTLSSHDPYVLPGHTARLLEGSSDHARFVNALAYTDRELGRFYARFLAEEAPRGTLLVLVGDHGGRVPFPGDPLDTSTGEAEYRFRVPLVIAGLAGAELSAARKKSSRLGGHLDVAQTLLGLVGVDTGSHCYQGRNLLAADYPARRHVVSLAGENLQFFYAHGASLRFMWALAERRVVAFDELHDATFRHDLYDPSTPEAASLAAFVPAYFRLGQYLNLGDHFAPPGPETLRREVRVAPERPLFAAHRGRTLGDPLEQKRKLPPDNSLAAIEAAIAAGFAWVELDLQVLRDGTAVLAHDPTFEARGREQRWAELTLGGARSMRAVTTLEQALDAAGERVGLLLELKPQRDIFETMRLTSAVMQALEKTPPSRVIIDSFRRNVLASFAELTPFEVGLDLPQSPVELEWLDYARSADFEWVYVEQSFLSAAVVGEAHARGLKVMAYTVNDPAQLEALAPERVDGVISDVAAPWGLTAPTPPRR